MPSELPRLETIFNEALESTAPDERAAFLDRACGDDEELRRGVEAILAAHENTGDVLQLPYSQRKLETVPVVGEGPGTTVGRYRLLEQIGEGGFGVVFMAEQQEPVRRKVALKILKPGMDSRQVLARFEAERQALALMDHPNIARVLDAGATDSGRPYFVMDMVKGVPITEFCDQHHLPTRQRLELFASLCHAVQHAHQKGIIHRDIKPTNVLVMMHDITPIVKVIDFGVAKALGQELTEKTLFTGFAQVVGTPLYMSPEQAGQSALDADTRSDIYSLGVLLYELLTGSTPFDKERFKKVAQDEIRRIIREEEPPKPSTRLSASKDSLPLISAQRHTEPAKLTKLVRGELDWIVMKSLEKDRNRRYATANGFAIDVQRYLAGEPVLAAPASQWYRLRKFARRHRGPVAATGLVLLTLLGGIAGTAWGLVRAEHQRQLAEAKQREAVDERNAKDLALKAEKKAREDETRARQQTFAALRSMTAEVVERKFAQGTVLTEDDRTFFRGIIAQYDAFAAIKGDDAESRALRAEGRLRVGTMRYQLGELQGAEKDYDQALGIYRQLAAQFPSRPEFRGGLASTHSNRGPLLRATGRLLEAEQDYDQALSLYKQLTDEFPSRSEFREGLASNHNNRGFLLSAKGQPNEAEKDYGQALNFYKQLADEFPSRPDFYQELANIHNNRANLLRETGRQKEAEKDYDLALSIQKHLADDFPSGPGFLQDLAMSYNNRGNLMFAEKRLEEAEKYYDQALGIRKQLAADYPSRPEFRRDLARCRYNRGKLLSEGGRPKEAEQDYDEALSLFKQLAADFRLRPEFRQQMAQTLNSRGTLMSVTGRQTQAEKDYDQALDICRQLADEFSDQPDLQNDLACTCVNLALFHTEQGNWTAAKRLLMEGRPHHLAALKVNPRHPTYRQFYRTHLGLLTNVHAGLLEQEDAVRTAKSCRDLGWDAPADVYDAACFLSQCIPIVAQHDKLDAKQRKEAAQFYGDAAMQLLREAVTKGYRDVPHTKQDSDLDPLRLRPDFQKLVAELESVNEKK